jgi:deoxycytidine triphosphate deaminase
MIWPDSLLKQWAESGGLSPFEPANVNPASVDLRWSGKSKLALGTYFKNKWSLLEDSDTLILYPNQLYLLDTLEYIKMPVNAAGILMLKSSIGRQGLEHLHAGFFDPGFCGTATLEIINVSPRIVTITRGQRIVQLALQQMLTAPEISYAYTGRYNGQSEPQEAK